VNLDRVSWECVHFVKARSLKTPAGVVVFALDGATVKSQADLFSCIAHAMMFPSYFGHNWDALDECLADMSWLPGPAGYVLLIRQGGGLWARLPQVTGQLVECWLSAAGSWAERGKSFHLVFLDM
jgi:hypothetical protein